MLANQVMTSEYIADIDCVIRMLRIGKNLSYKYPQFECRADQDFEQVWPWEVLDEEYQDCGLIRFYKTG